VLAEKLGFLEWNALGFFEWNALGRLELNALGFFEFRSAHKMNTRRVKLDVSWESPCKRPTFSWTNTAHMPLTVLDAKQWCFK